MDEPDNGGLEYVPVETLCEYRSPHANIHTERSSSEYECGATADTVVQLKNPEELADLEYEEVIETERNADWLGDGLAGILKPAGVSVPLCRKHAHEVADGSDAWEIRDDIDLDLVSISSIPARVAERVDGVPVKQSE